MSLTIKKKAQLLSLLKLAPSSGASIRQIASAVGCSTNTVQKYRRELQNAGEIPHSLAERNRHLTDLTPHEPQLTVAENGSEGGALQPDWEGLLERARQTAILTPDEEMRLLSVIMTDPKVAPQYQVQASRQLAALRTQYAPKDSLGPPPPLSREDRIARLADLMDAVGPDIAGQALGRAFPGSTWRVRPQYPTPTEPSDEATQ